MAHSARRDSPELPDFSILKRLARDQLIYLLEQVGTRHSSCRRHTHQLIKHPEQRPEQGIFGDVSIDEWPFYLLPLDDDIISLELPEFFQDNFLAGDQRWVRTAGSALHLLYSLYGPFSKVYGIGRCSKMAYESWREQVEEGEQKARQAEIGNVFLIDRDVDFVTPLCSQVVYEGLVDDIFRIKCGCVEFGPDVTASDKSVKVMLNSQDKVFSEIRNEHFSNVFGFLSQKARNLQTAYDKRRGMDIKQMKTFVSEELKGLKQEHRLLTLHIGASESIMKKKTKQDFQELLKTEHCKNPPLCSLFQSRCVEFGPDVTASDKSVKVMLNSQDKVFSEIRNEHFSNVFGFLSQKARNLQTAYDSYGVDHLLTFSNLRQLGLLVEQQPGETLTVMESKVGKLVNDKTAGKLTDAFSSLAKKSNFRALSRKLNLVPKADEEYDLRVPRDMAYIFSGAYIPLSCKLIEQVLERDGWTGLEEVTRLLNGHEFAVTGSSGVDSRGKNDTQRIILVMFLGGCTYSEISALRFLGREKGYKFIVVTTAITNSSRLLEALLDNHV
ncbi:vacuolar protein sorting-associated protein 33B [Neolamprologus brichardi]|uniref:vacuolar protein sorting-associated protein 33B n=1 Tax=Neolamprologus brichardi TaxID=32507 RepID=UPI0016438D6E|nr:vacuolar protein sorting-associated protein 33B [Neolamprologus brichardi]